MQQDLEKLARALRVERYIIDRRMVAIAKFTASIMGASSVHEWLGAERRHIIARRRYGRWMEAHGWRLLAEAGFGCWNTPRTKVQQ